MKTIAIQSRGTGKTAKMMEQALSEQRTALIEKAKKAFCNACQREGCYVRGCFAFEQFTKELED